MMSQVSPLLYPTLLSLPSIDHYEAILLDAYGVFWGGNAAGLIPGSQDTMAELIKRGKIVGILSNTTQLIEKEKQKLSKHGLHEGIHYHFLMTSGDATRALLLNDALPFATPYKKYWPFCPDHPTFGPPSVFKNTSFTPAHEITEADFIYVTVPHFDGLDQTEPQKFSSLIQELVMTELPMVCANPDRFAHEGIPPRLVVRQGSIASLYEQMGGIVHYIGKPYPAVYGLALEKFTQIKSLSKSQILMVGDTPETDIRGAKQMDIDSALVLQTGIMHERTKEESWQQVIQDLTQDDFPTYFIQRLGLP